MESINATSVSSVLRWLGTGSNVLLQGPYGSGRSAVLREVAEDLRLRGRETLLVRGLAAASTTPLGPFLLETHLVEDLGGASTVAEVVAYVSGRLTPRGAVLLVDDLAYLDQTTAAVLEAVVEDRSVQVVCVCDVGQVHPLAARLARRAATARIQPLGLRSTARLLTTHLGSEVALSTAAEIARKSAGNPGVALALADAAVYAGTLTRKDASWSLTASLDAVPLDGVVNATLVALPPETARALASLALVGATTLEVARRLVPTHDLQTLVDLGHVSTSPIGGGLLVFVSSPALATAVVAGLGPLERHDLEARVRTVVSPDLPRAGGGPVEAPWTVPAGALASDELAAVSSALTLLTERAATEVDRQSAAWRRSPDPSTGVPLLRSLLVLHRSSTAQIDEVLRETRCTDGLGPDAGWFLVLRARWAAWNAVPFDLEDAVEDLGARREDFPATAAYEVFQTCARMRVAAVDTGTVLTPLPSTQVGEGLRTVDQVARLLEAAAVGEAAAVDTTVLDDQADHLGDLRDSLEIDTLVLAGRLGAARRRARASLAAAYETFDLLRIRWAARSVATVAFAAGDLPGAWAALSTVLLLGPTGAMTVSMDQRVLGLASIARSRAGDSQMAASLLADLQKIPSRYRTGLDFFDAWAEAELYSAADPSSVAAADLLWAAGERALGRGDRTSALACWVLTSTPLPAERLSRLEELWAEVDVPCFAPYLRLHSLLVSGTGDDLLRALRPPSISGPVVRSALAVVDERRAADGLTPLTDDEILVAAGSGVLDAAGRGAGRRGGAPQLSDREHEVVARARAGQSNAEIAADLFLSRRTVENHLYRALRKLGISGRSELLRT